ncbi:MULTISPECIES: MBL fold metallo-hydrolase [Thioclava]|uniref:MBL fold metallo-hydrolase n=1 Tax=Thioclava litoralis TaxID=3076557 RepID=A0ABZ1DX28_9RHOB|nr:MBL fold metallo-hydrolase [Thioclava sp. FTW29]
MNDTETRPRSLRYPWTTPPEQGALCEVAPDVYWFRLPLPMALDHMNGYALDEGDSWTLVDTGIDRPACRAALQALLEGPLSSKPVGRVVVTHHHPDHIGLAGWLQAQGAELWTTRTAWLMARMLQLDVQERPDAQTVAFWKAAGMRADILAKRLAERPFNFADCTAPLPLGYRRLVEGEVLRMAGRDWTVRMGHGHAPEHATFWSEDLVLGGDQILPSISANLGVYATEPEADPVAGWMDSTRGFRPYATERQLVLPGHKLPFYGLPTRLDQMIQNHEGALKRLRAHLGAHPGGGPKTACDCFPPLFKREITEAVYGLAMVEAVAHLNHLHHRGEVGRVARADGAWLWHLL